MGTKTTLLEKLQNVEHLATISKTGRLMRNPFRYAYAIIFKNLIYPITKKSFPKKTTIFSGRQMNILLPSATDIYLTGGKSHNSEIRLARFMIQTLSAGNQVMDIGAHYGYFSLLISELIGKKGKLIAFEPASASLSVLKENCSPFENISVIEKAVSDKAGEISFYEFPNLFSEYNSVDAEQFKNEKWFDGFNPAMTTVKATSVNDITETLHFTPSFIKIDAEGAELTIIKGGMYFFKNHNPVIAMEYQNTKRNNSQYGEAVALLRKEGYKTYIINHDGQIREIDNIEAYLDQNGLVSDNIILKK